MTYLNFKSISTWFMLVVDTIMLIALASIVLGLIHVSKEAWSTETPYLLILLVVVILSFLIGAQWAYYDDYKNWNHGICKKNGKPWVCFDVDSQGGRGYKAGNCSIWISYPVDKRIRRR